MSTERMVFAAVAAAIADSAPEGVEYELNVWVDHGASAIRVHIRHRRLDGSVRVSIQRALPIIELVRARDPQDAIDAFAEAVTLPLRMAAQGIPQPGAPPHPQNPPTVPGLA